MSKITPSEYLRDIGLIHEDVLSERQINDVLSAMEQYGKHFSNQQTAELKSIVEKQKDELRLLDERVKASIDNYNRLQKLAEEKDVHISKLTNEIIGIIPSYETGKSIIDMIQDRDNEITRLKQQGEQKEEIINNKLAEIQQMYESFNENFDRFRTDLETNAVEFEEWIRRNKYFNMYRAEEIYWKKEPIIESKEYTTKELYSKFKSTL